MKNITQFHENPAVIAWWCARLGRALAWQTPVRRRAILALAALGAGIIAPIHILIDRKQSFLLADKLSAVFIILSLFALLWLIYRAAANFSTMPLTVRRHPQLVLHLFYWGVLAVLWNTSANTGLWRNVLLGVAVIFPLLIWRCGYLLSSGQYGRMAGTRFRDHLIYLWPAYGGNETPYGKGHDYLSRYEAKTEQELARSQLSGIRLILLGMLWGISLFVMEGFFYGDGNALTKMVGGYTVGIPALGQLVKQGSDAPLAVSWISIYCELIKQVLRHAAGGHGIIGILRLFGFNVFRNTYKPLLAESITEFWNRYYYYFKELLTHFFFMPTFIGLGKKLHAWPNIRLLVSVFAAAFVGNMYYHLLEKTVNLAEGSVLDSLYSLRSRIFYCLLLFIGIYISMLREQHRRGHPTTQGKLHRFLRIFGVWTFFGLIFIWDVGGRAPFLSRLDFFLGLFGLG